MVQYYCDFSLQVLLQVFPTHPKEGGGEESWRGGIGFLRSFLFGGGGLFGCSSQVWSPDEGGHQGFAKYTGMGLERGGISP